VTIGGGRSWAALAGLAAVVVAGSAALLASGVSSGDVGTWLGAVAAGVMVPGLVGVRALRGARALGEDLAWSLPVGCVLALLTWAVGVVALHRPVAPSWAGVFALAMLAVGPVRRRVLAGGGPGWGRGSGGLVVVSLVVTTGWAWGSTLASVPTSAADRAFFWAPDVMFHTALAGELARTAAPVYPMVPEGTYPYHWFFHALAAHLGQGLGPLVVVTHLLPLTLLLGVVAMAAVAAAAVARHRWGAGAGAGLTGLVGATLPHAWVVLTGITGRSDTDGPALDPIRLYWQHSASTTLGWLAGLGILAAAAPVLREGPGRHRRDLALVVIMGALAAGAKAVQPPVLLCGTAAVVLLGLLRRRRTLTVAAGAVGAAVAVPWLVAMLTMYAGGSQGLAVSPGAVLGTTAGRLVPALAPVGADGDRATTPVVAATVLAVWLLPLVPRLLGLLWWVRRPVDPLGLLCLGTVAAGLAGTFLTTHPGNSQVFFLVGSYPVGVAGSAAGLVLAALHLAGRWGARRVVTACAVAALGGVVATVVLAAWAGQRSPVTVWRATRPDAVPPGEWLGAREQLLAWAAPTLVLAGVVIATTTLGVLFAGRPDPPGIRRRASGVLVVLAAGLAGAGLAATARDVASGSPAAVAAREEGVLRRNPPRSRLLVTPALWEAADIVRRSAAPDDVVVTNRACLQPATVLRMRTCDPRDFVVSALTGRRTGVSGWAYAAGSLDRAGDVDGGYTRMPFWDPARLAEQRALVEAPNLERAAAAWNRGERWVLADRSAGSVSPDIATLGQVLLDRDGVVLVRLSRPAPSG
jgi:hypothetical protein